MALGNASEIPVLLSSDDGTPQEIAVALVYALRLLSWSTGATHAMRARMAHGEALASPTQDNAGQPGRRARAAVGLGPLSATIVYAAAAWRPPASAPWPAER
jgi:hypothetical protein